MLLIGIVAVASGLGLGFVISRMLTQQAIARAKQEAGKLVKDARKDIERLQKEAELEAKDRLYQARQAFEQENRDRRNELVEQERRLNQREQSLDILVNNAGTSDGGRKIEDIPEETWDARAGNFNVGSNIVVDGGESVRGVQRAFYAKIWPDFVRLDR